MRLEGKAGESVTLGLFEHQGFTYIYICSDTVNVFIVHLSTTNVRVEYAHDHIEPDDVQDLQQNKKTVDNVPLGPHPDFLNRLHCCRIYHPVSNNSHMMCTKPFSHQLGQDNMRVIRVK